METQNGPLFLKNLAYYVRSHEKALASSAQSQRPSRHSRASSTNTITTIANGKPAPSGQPAGRASSTYSLPSLSNALHLSSFRMGSSKPKAAKLYLTPNQLYYLLSRFEELGVSVGPMNVRLESINAKSTTSNYVSFLTQAQNPPPGTKDADQDSIHSVSSIKSVMSSMSNLWSNFGLGFNTAEKLEKRRAAEMEDLRYLYSAFTKIPYLKLGDDRRIPRIADYEEFPFDSAVPLTSFKNLETLEIVDLDFRSFFGWDRVADQIRCLILKRAGVDDLNDLLTNIVLDDMDRRRRRSSRNPPSPLQTSVLSTPGGTRQTGLARSLPSFETLSNTPDDRRHSLATTYGETRPTGASARRALKDQQRGSSRSPSRPATASTRQSRVDIVRRSSGSSNSSIRSRSGTTRSSSTNLLHLATTFPVSKWQFLRHLSLADNKLTTIGVHALAPVSSTLQSLDLSSNLFSEIPEALTSLIALRALSLAGCKIESLHSLIRNPLPAIEALNLRGNKIVSLAGIEKLLFLERLDVRENLLNDPKEMARMTVMPGIVEVFVSKNPFVKTHEHYRISIFNIFRQTPGYTNDILVDSTGPSHHEKKHLVERVHELDSVPVIRPPFDDEQELPPSPTDSVEQSIEALVEPLRPGSSATLVPEPPQQSATPPRKKATKRRVVDMSQPFGSPGTRGSFEVGSPEAAVSTERQHPSLGGGDIDNDGSPRHGMFETASYVLSSSSAQTDSTDQYIPAVPRSASLDIEDGAAKLLSWRGPELPHEEYRKKIESLRRDYGNNWLSALANDQWTNNSVTPTHTFGIKDINLAVPFDVRTISINTPISTGIDHV